MTDTKIKCSLCLEDVTPEELRAHRERDKREMVEYTIGVIRSHHPEWAEKDPACQRCWDYYESLPTK